MIGKPIEKILGSKVKTVDCYVSMFDAIPVLAIARIYLEDGREITVDGEHDCAYLPIDEGMNLKALQELVRSEGEEFASEFQEYWDGNIAC